MGDQSGIRARSERSITIDFYYRGVRCRERLKKAPTPANLKWAVKKKATIELEIAEGRFDYANHFPDSKRLQQLSPRRGDALLLKNYLETWLESERARIEHSTWVGYQKVIKYNLVPAFGTLALSEIRRKHLYEWADKHPDMSAKRARNILSTLRIAFGAAVKRELVDTTPFVGFKLEKRKSKSEDIDPFSQAERAAIVNALVGQNQNFVQFAFWTGLRTSELVALDWSAIDWIRGVVVVSRKMTQGMPAPEEGTKTEAGTREVKLLTPALEALKAQKTHTFLKGAEVFQRRPGERWTGDKAIRESMWIPALKRAGVRYRKPYQTRHTYASMMLTAGENLLWVAGQMGHVDAALTLKRYSRWIASDMPDAGNKAVSAWSHLGHSAAVGH